jgi:phytoene synthase
MSDEVSAAPPLVSLDLESKTRAIMRKGSKTFALASLFFDKDSREGAQLLYTWCRACDDAVDNEPDIEKARQKLDELKASTHNVFLGSTTPLREKDLTFTAFELLSRKHGIKQVHAQALLDGMSMDVEGAHIRTNEDLELYCYRVAGVVGLMMSKVMGVTHPLAARHAVDTGLAMQMTNISRDMREDFERQRIYIPDTWFIESERPAFNLRFQPEQFRAHAHQLVSEAELLYKSGIQGLKYLPFRAALAVACAQAFYRENGRKVVARGNSAWDTRTIVSLPRKMWLMVIAVANVARSRFT